MFSISHTAIIAFSILSLPAIPAQFVSSLPQCVQDCINQSQDDNCEVTDIKCLCRASAGNFLPDLITCMHGNCDNNLDNNLLLTPLQLACTLAGVPIPAAALRNAENEASSLATQVTTTVTQPGPPGAPGPATTTVAAGTTLSTATVTTTQSGTTYYEIYPITILSTTTVSGPASTQTVYSGGSSSSGSLSTAISSSSNTNTDTTTTTSVAAQATTSIQSTSIGSSTSSASKPGQTDSAPFTDTNHNGARAKEGINVWLWTAVLVINLLMWL